MSLDPLTIACTHLPTPAEQQRDPRYLACNAAPGKPCLWARRFDGLANPPFHAERLEACAARTLDNATPLTPEAFDAAVLATGLV